MPAAFVIAGARTPIGRFQGGLSSLSAPELGALAVREALARSGLSPAQVQDVILGEVVTAGVGQAPARQAALLAGLPDTVPALTINKVCGSGLQAVMLADQAIRAGDVEIVVAGGMESMSRAPHLLRGSREGFKYGDAKLDDALILDGLWCATGQCHMGEHAEYTARKAGISRQALDEFGLESHARAVRAKREGKFDAELIPVTTTRGKTTLTVAADEAPRADAALESLARLKPAFRPDGVVTAGNSSPLSDGAAAVIVTSESVARRAARPGTARIIAHHTSGGPPQDIFFAPIAAVRDVLQKAGLRASDIDLFEINEAFASQMLACVQELDLPRERVNIHGGAIALGHPIGASGARVLVTLLAALERYQLRRGLASLCLGGGNAVALIVERVPA